MSKLLLDTNVISELMKAEPDARVINWFDQQPETSLFISAITRAEIESGIAILPEGRRKQSLWAAAEELLSAFERRCYAFDCHITSTYAEVLRVSRLTGRPVTTEDAQIATIALSYDLTLVTRNSRDFEFFPATRLLNPWNGQAVVN